MGWWGRCREWFELESSSKTFWFQTPDKGRDAFHYPRLLHHWLLWWGNQLLLEGTSQEINSSILPSLTELWLQRQIIPHF